MFTKTIYEYTELFVLISNCLMNIMANIARSVKCSKLKRALGNVLNRLIKASHFLYCIKIVVALNDSPASSIHYFHCQLQFTRNSAMYLEAN